VQILPTPPILLVQQEGTFVHHQDASQAPRCPVERRPISHLLAAALLCLALVAAGCSDDSMDNTSTTGATTSTTGATTSTTGATTTTTTGSTTTSAFDATVALFIDSEASLSDDPHAARQRPVGIDLDVLLREDGTARVVEEITINLFPDVVYTGVITGTERSGDSYSWVGYLEGIEYSSLAMVYTASVFRAQFASPAGVYAVSLVGDGIYQAILIDQEAFPQGEG